MGGLYSIQLVIVKAQANESDVSSVSKKSLTGHAAEPCKQVSYNAFSAMCAAPLMWSVRRFNIRDGNEIEKGESFMIRSFFSVLFMCSLIALAGSEVPTLSATQVSQTSQEYESAQEGIRAAINHYFKGHATGDASHMRKAFLATAHIEGIREGKFTSWTLDEYCALFKGKSAGDESTRVRTIDLIDVSGNSGMAKATLVHGATVFTDYFVLLKVGDEWKIANKVYYGRKNDRERR